MKIRIRPGKMLSDYWRRFAPSALICLLLTVWGVTGEAINLYASDAFQTASSTPLNYSGAALAMGLLFATAASCLCERHRWPKAVSWIAAVAGAGIGALFVWMKAPGMIPVGVILCGLALCLHGVSRKDAPAARLSQVCARFLVSSFISGLLFGALSLCTSAIFSLFLPDASWELNEIFYVSAACISCLIFAPCLFLGGLPEDETPSSAPSAFQKFADIILLPFFFLPAAILLFYVAKIAITQTMPVGVMNGYSLYVLTSFVFFHLILNGGEGKVSRFFKRWGGWLLIPIAVVQAIAVHMRVSAYGLTPSRIYGIVWTVLCLATVTVSLFRKRANWFFLAAALVSIGIFCTPLSAENLAIMDQEHRLEEALKRNDMINEQGEIVANPNAAFEDQEIIYSAADYLYRTTAREGSLTEQLQTGIDAIRREDGTPEDNIFMFSLSDAEALLFGFEEPEQADSDWYSHTYTFKGTAVSNRLETSGYAFAEWISFTYYDDGTAMETWTYDKEESFTLVCTGTTDIAALVDCLEANNESSEPLNLTVPVTFVIDGEEIDIAPLLTGVQFVDGIADLPVDTLILPSGRKLHIASVRVHNYSNEDSDDYIGLSAWLLTPEAE